MPGGHVPSQLTLVVCLPLILDLPESSRPPGVLEIHLLACRRQPQCLQCSAPLDSRLCCSSQQVLSHSGQAARGPRLPSESRHELPSPTELPPLRPRHHPRDWDLTPYDPPQVEPSGAEGVPGVLFRTVQQLPAPAPGSLHQPPCLAPTHCPHAPITPGFGWKWGDFSQGSWNLHIEDTLCLQLVLHIEENDVNCNEARESLRSS